MPLLYKKLFWECENEIIDRQSVMKILEKSMQEKQVGLLYGIPGAGKTTAVLEYAKRNLKGAYGYYLLDEYDNDEAVFQNYFIKMLENAGIKLEEADKEISLHTIVVKTLEAGQKPGDDFLIILDGIESLKEGTVSKEVEYLLEHLPPNFKVILLCDTLLSGWLKNIMLQCRVGEIPVSALAYSKTEIMAAFLKNKKRITKEEAAAIKCRTGGSPGLIYFLMKDLLKIEGKITEEKLSRMSSLRLYIDHCIWESCTKKEKELLLYGSCFAYLSEELCSQILGMEPDTWTFYCMEKKGVLTCQVGEGRYRVPTFFKDYMIACRSGEIRSRVESVYEQALRWYEKRSQIREVLRIVCQMRDIVRINDYLSRYVDRIIHILSAVEIEECVSLLSKSEKTPEVIYLEGRLGIEKRETKREEEAILALQRFYREANGEEKGRYAELFLNLLFTDPGISIREWFGFAKKYLMPDGKILLYDAVGSHIDVRTGAKDLTSLFAEGDQEEKKSIQKWKNVVAESQGKIVDLAAADYLLETNREKESQEKVEILVQELGQETDPNFLLGMVALLCKLARRHRNASEYKERLDDIEKCLRENGYWQAKRKIEALKAYTYGWTGQREEMAQWILHKAPGNKEKITYENAYGLLVKAKGFLILKQYTQAQNLFSKLAGYYEVKGQIQQQAECRFAQAVALCEVGEKEPALKMAAEALTLGAGYRYIGPYTEWGETGVELIERYQDLMEKSDQKIQIHRKKKYFYGNVLRASFEGYQAMLLGCAKREKRQGAARGKQQELLTVTEFAILQHIANGDSNRQISEKMNIKLPTVKTHLSSVYRKLEVNCRTAAIKKGKELEII